MFIVSGRFNVVICSKHSVENFVHVKYLNKDEVIQYNCPVSLNH